MDEGLDALEKSKERDDTQGSELYVCSEDACAHRVASSAGIPQSCWKCAYYEEQCLQNQVGFQVPSCHPVYSERARTEVLRPFGQHSQRDMPCFAASILMQLNI